MASDKTSLGNRMKTYEKVHCNYLMKRTPVMLRVDGKAFHTFCKGFKKPFDEIVIECMKITTQSLCEKIQNCVFAYTQSDEITFVLVDYENINTEPWFNNNIQKICSVTASMTTMEFNTAYAKMVSTGFNNRTIQISSPYFSIDKNTDSRKLKQALFDCRAFNVPIDEVCNCLIWRQQDAVRNSIQALGQANFSHKSLQKKSCNDIKEMLLAEKSIDWNDLEIGKQRGFACYKNDSGKWIIDENIPIFSTDRNFIERHILYVV